LRVEINKKQSDPKSLRDFLAHRFKRIHVLAVLAQFDGVTARRHAARLQAQGPEFKTQGGREPTEASGSQT
jgi:hypothetical protein